MKNDKVWNTVPDDFDKAPHIKKPVAVPTQADPNVRHVFESAGLGKAPYTFIGVEERRGPLVIPGTNLTCGAPGQPMGACKYCSTAIAYLFWLKSADNKQFYVGSDCIYKSGDAGLRRIIDPIVAEQIKETRDARAKYLVEKFEAILKERPNFWAETNQGPHPYPYYAQQGRTLADYKRFCYEHSGLASKAKIARQVLIGLGLEKPTRTKKTVAV